MSKEYTKKALEALKKAVNAAKETGQDTAGSEHLLLGILRSKNCLAYEILDNAGVTEASVFDLMSKMPVDSDHIVTDRDPYTPRARKVLERAASEALRFDSETIGTEHILLGILKERDSVASRLLSVLNIDVKKIYTDTISAMGQDVSSVMREDNIFFREDGSSDTPTLDKYSRDLTHMAKNAELDPVIGRDTEIERIMQILNRRTKNNPCLIGDPGVGKTAIAEGIAQRIVTGNVPETLSGKRLVTLDLPGMVAGSKYRGEFEERIKKVISEVIASGDVLLFLDEIHTIIGAGNAEGAIDASNILKPFLARGEIQLIGATTTDEYRKHIEKDAALERRFQPVTINEPTEDEAVKILKGLKSIYEEYHGVVISDEAINAAVRLSRRYLTERFLPDKAIDLIDEAASRVGMIKNKPDEKERQLRDLIEKLEAEKENAIINNDFEMAAQLRAQKKKEKEKLERIIKKNTGKKKKPVITIGDEEIASVVSMWTKIPLNKLTQKESERLIALEDELHKRVIGQDEAVSSISRAIRRGRVGIGDPGKPVGSFIFLGPTGVGKTELSKAIAEALFGTEDSLIRIDMSEYMEKHSVAKLIGSPPGYVGYGDGGQLSEKVRRNPYSVILFDEIEKADPDIFNVLLQVLDDGRITDSDGRTVDFKNTVIIMTSNIGARNIIEPKTLGFASVANEDTMYEDMKSKVMEDLSREFRPEFLNRVDEILVFRQLSKEQVKKIAGLMLNNLAKRAKESLGIDLKIMAATKEYIADKGFDIKYGARPLKRRIQTDLEDVLAEKVLKGEISSGDKVTISAKNDNIIIKVN